jgi:hypothetical protein
MTVELKCDGCQTLLRVPDEMSGKRAKCTQCGTIFTIPSATQHFWPPGMKGPTQSAPRRTPAAKPASMPSAAPAAAQPVVAPAAAPMALPVSDLGIMNVADAAPLAMSEAEVAQPAAPLAIRDTVSIGRAASTRDTVRTPAATSGSRPIPIERPKATPEAGGQPRLQLGDVLSRARGIFKSRWTNFALVGSVYLLVYGLATGALVSGLRMVRAPEVIQFLVPQALLAWLMVGMVMITVRAARGRKADLKTLFSGMPQFPATLVIWMLCFAPLAAIALGLSAAGVAAPIVAMATTALWSIVYYFAWIPSLVALVDHEPRPVAAWKQAMAYATANLPVLVGLFAVSLFVLLVACLPAGLLLPLAVPFILLASTVAYLRSRPARS